ncbi:hypothetical protein AB6A40_000242 [Gnathostoma spinigerum]|uniref:Uncharacterized protein n=1 Tax=Gnathostoma spinigerum TaxID=75299 RepID=A0ABD6E1S9_9BILA
MLGMSTTSNDSFCLDKGCRRCCAVKNERIPRFRIVRILALLLVIAVVLSFCLPSLSGVLDLELYPAKGPVSFRFGSDYESQQCFGYSYSERVSETRKVLESVRRDLLAATRQLRKIHDETESLNKQIVDQKAELNELNLEIDNLRRLRDELNDQKNVRVSLPHAPPSRNSSLDEYLPPRGSDTFETVFDFSRCSVAGGFRLFIYDLPSVFASDLSRRYVDYFRLSRFVTKEPSEACLFIVVFEKPFSFSSLPHWRKGTNHLLLNVGSEPLRNTSNAIVASSAFSKRSFRPHLDIAAYFVLPDYSKDQWKYLPSLLPYERKYLLSYFGAIPDEMLQLRNDFDQFYRSASKSGDTVLFNLSCSSSSSALCFTRPARAAVLRESMFVLLITDEFPSPPVEERLYEALAYGAIPVVLSLDFQFPFDDFIDWNRISYRLPIARLPELHFILRSFSPSDILEMRRHGRFVLENYLCNIKVMTLTIEAALRYRIGVPSVVNFQERAEPLFNNSFIAPISFPPTPPSFEEEYLGPQESPHPSSAYLHNFTSLQMYSNHLWNDVAYGVFDSAEFLAFDKPYPSDSEYDSSLSTGFRPIAPGSGVEFSTAMGGNRPREQFTVVLLTYRRSGLLVAALERLNRLPYLNKVLVVWNDVDSSPKQDWPKLHVPVQFIKAKMNSLNNRFLPYDLIETEAVLSLDDDIDLKQHEIIFAFRVWREQRTKIVGFPARYHARYGEEIYYNSNHTCQYSMVLTGASFIHKMYFYIYSYSMPAVIREKVDEIMNCEDVAMNFLVSHLTRSPPIKATTKWTIRCPTCSEMLSQDATHFSERHECIRFFASVYGYNPLLFSQYRVDSVLFKTRLPPNHQKCFRYV